MSHQALTRYGYILNKKHLSEAKQRKIRKDLTMKPLVIPAFQDFVRPQPFKIFTETPKNLYVPRYYGLDNFGPPKSTPIEGGVPLAPGLEIIYDILPHQTKSWKSIRETFALDPENGDRPLKCDDDSNTQMVQPRGGVLSIPCGYGKCLGKDTPVMMYDGSFKMSQDIQPGDQLMGDDSTPRNVLTTCTGKERLYRVTPTKGGDPYVVNESHILSLTFSSNCSFKGEKYHKGDIIDLPLKEFIRLSPQRQATLRGYRVPITFPHREVDDPYLMGHSSKGIPDLYKYNSREIQLKVLAGIVDVYGMLVGETPHDLLLNADKDKLIDDVIFLCRSLGFSCYKGKEVKILCEVYTTGKTQEVWKTFHEIHIRGIDLDQIPVKMKCIGAPPLRQTKDALITKIQVEKLAVGDYYGFTLDGNGRFLLGDFQVTHNTFLAIKLAVHLGRKTLVVVPNETLMDQWVERIQEFTKGRARVGIIQRAKIEYQDQDFVIAMLHSLSMKTYGPEIFEEFGLVICDEVHHIAANTFSRSLPKIAAPYTLGLSATPDRPDGLSEVFYHYLGPLFHAEKRSGANRVVVKAIHLKSESKYFQEEFLSNGTKNTSVMNTNVSKFPTRNALIVEVLRVLVKQNRKILLLSARRDQLEVIRDSLEQASLKTGRNKYATFGLYYGNKGGNKKNHKKMLEESAKCDVILGTTNIAQEGLDIPTLNTLVLVSSLNKVEQATGRILRKYHLDINPMVVDLVDRCGNYPKHFGNRKKFYLSENYVVEILRITIEDDVQKLKPQVPNLRTYLDKIPKPDELAKQEAERPRLNFKGKCLVLNSKNKASGDDDDSQKSQESAEVSLVLSDSDSDSEDSDFVMPGEATAKLLKTVQPVKSAKSKVPWPTKLPAKLPTKYKSAHAKHQTTSTKKRPISPMTQILQGKKKTATKTGKRLPVSLSNFPAKKTGSKSFKPRRRSPLPVSVTGLPVSKPTMTHGKKLTKKTNIPHSVISLKKTKNILLDECCLGDD